MNVSDRSSIRNLAVFGLYLLQLALAGVVPYADARLEAETAHVSTHVESESSARCGLAHDHTFCQLCRAIQLGAQLVTPTGPGFARLAYTRDFECATDVDPRSNTSFLPVGSRAPPRI